MNLAETFSYSIRSDSTWHGKLLVHQLQNLQQQEFTDEKFHGCHFSVAGNFFTRCRSSRKNMYMKDPQTTRTVTIAPQIRPSSTKNGVRSNKAGTANTPNTTHATTPFLRFCRPHSSRLPHWTSSEYLEVLYGVPDSCIPPSSSITLSPGISFRGLVPYFANFLRCILGPLFRFGSPSASF